MTTLYNKYLPKSLEEIQYHPQCVEILNEIDKNNIPHMIFYGTDGCGKKTLLNSFFGNCKKYKHLQKYKTTNKELEFIVLKNNNFLEVDIDEMGMYNKYIVKDVIKEMAQTRKVNDNKIQIIVMHHSELLDKSSQYVLRRIMEIYNHNCRFILLCNSINKIIKPLQSRCLCIRINSLTEEDMYAELKKIKKAEKIKITAKNIRDIISISDRNFKRSLLLLEYYDTKKSCKIDEYKSILKKLYTIINSKNLNLSSFTKIDEIIYKLLVKNDLDSTDIFKVIFNYFVNILNDEDDKIELTLLLSKYEHQNKIGAKDIFHLQAFIFNIADLIKKRSK